MSPTCPHVAAVRYRCVCGHGAVFHNLTGGRRTACSILTGRRGVPCGCPAYTPEET